MKHTSILSPFLVALLLAACSPDGEQKPPSHQAGSPPEVSVAQPLVRDTVPWMRFTGRLEPSQSVDVQARVSGPLRWVHFGDGEFVDKGQLLFTIDQDLFLVAVASAEAALKQAKAQLTRSEALHRQAKTQIKQADAAKSLADVRLENAKNAAATNSIAKQQLDERKSELAQAEASAEGARASAASAEAEIATAKASILSAEAGLAKAKLDLEYTSVHAPISGRVSRRMVTPGNLIQGGSGTATLLTSIVSLDPIHVYVEASERDVVQYLKGTSKQERDAEEIERLPMYMALMGEKGAPHVGQFDFADNRLNPSTGTLTIRGVFRNANNALKPGLFATTYITTGHTQSVMLVPDEAIGADQSTRFVLVVGKGGVVERKPVVTGKVVDGLRAVVSGLSGSDRVIVRGIQRARPGAPVTPVDEDIQAVAVDDGLPDVVEPISKKDWIRIPDEELAPTSEVEKGK